MAKNKTQNKVESKFPKRLEVGGGIIMSIIFAALPFWKLIFVPVAIIGFSIGILLMASALSKEVLWKSFVIPATIMTLCALSLISWHLYNKELKQPNFAVPDTLTSPVLRDLNIRISDLTREDFRIRNKTFKNCHIYGPAVIYISPNTNNVVAGNTFVEISPEGGFITTSNKEVSGAIGLEDCVIQDCIFHRISIIGSPEEIEYLKSKFKIYTGK
jgi:hypothetical protein